MKYLLLMRLSLLCLLLGTGGLLVLWSLHHETHLPDALIPVAMLLVIVGSFLLILALRAVQKQREDDNEQLRLLRSLIDSIPDLIWIKNKASEFVLVNSQFTRAFKKPLQFFLGKTDFDLSPPEQANKYYQDDLRVMRESETLITEEPVTGADGKIAWSETTKAPLLSQHGEVIGSIGIARNVTARKEAQERLAFLAAHDELTQLPNRRTFEQNLALRLRRLNTDETAAVLYIDLDNFKFVNDSLGHLKGDIVLQEIAERLLHSNQGAQLFGRIGGDELIAACIGKDAHLHAEQIANDLMALIHQPVNIDQSAYQFTSSIGVALYPEHAHNVSGLLQCADIALLQAKRRGKGRVFVYNRSFDGLAQSELTMHHDIRRALDQREFVIHFQPQYDVTGRLLVGLEALIRWQHPTEGLLFPDHFIPYAERSFLIEPIDRYVFGACCEQIRNWLDAGMVVPPISINVSSVDLETNGFIEHILAEIDRWRVPRGLIEIELTERLFLLAGEQISALLAQFKTAGIPIAIDDFGTGYSNLGYLVTYPINQLKIDRLFIRQLHTSKAHRIITEALVRLAHDLGLDLIAEGVETDEERALLESFGCPKIQGYLFNKPMSLESTTQLLRDQVHTFAPL